MKSYQSLQIEGVNRLQCKHSLTPYTPRCHLPIKQICFHSIVHGVLVGLVSSQVTALVLNYLDLQDQVLILEPVVARTALTIYRTVHGTTRHFTIESSSCVGQGAEQSSLYYRSYDICSVSVLCTELAIPGLTVTLHPVSTICSHLPYTKIILLRYSNKNNALIYL